MPFVDHNNVFKIEGNPIIHRYIDLTKFISLLHKNALFFTRADKQEDPFEGTYAKPNYAARQEWSREWYRKKGTKITDAVEKQIEKSILDYDNFAFRIKSLMTLNCWHKNDVESAVMWKSYCSVHAGILIKSKYENLKNSFHVAAENISISDVEYLNYEADLMIDGNTTYPFIHKQKFYKEENEIRALHEVSQVGWVHDWSKEESEFGIYIKTDLQVLVDEIIVAPFAPEWYFKLVQSLNEKYELNKPLKKSALAI